MIFIRWNKQFWYGSILFNINNVNFEMGNQNNQLRENEGYEIVSELPIGNIVKSTKNDSLHFLK